MASTTPRSRKPHGLQKDRGAIFDAALDRGLGLTLPKGLSPEAARKFYVEHAPTEWTEQEEREWRTDRLVDWQRRRDDPPCSKLRALIGAVIRERRAFARLDEMPLPWCARDHVHEKITEALHDALDGLLRDKERLENRQHRQRYIGSEIQDARDRMGLDPERFKRQEAGALKMLSGIEQEEQEESDQPFLGGRKRIMDDLALDLFVIVRHVTPYRSTAAFDRVSDKRIHLEAVSPIQKAFPAVDPVVPRRTAGHSGDVQAAPKVRLARHLSAEARKSASAAYIWQDGREALSAAGLVLRARYLRFSWDTRFDPALFQNRKAATRGYIGPS